MGAFEKLFQYFNDRRNLKSYFKMLDGYTPVFSNYAGGVYEMELTRSCIHAFATHCSKLQHFVLGPDGRGIDKILSRKPNPFMTGSQFLYKAATIYETQNTVIILPILDRLDRTVGFYPANPRMVEIVSSEDGEPFVRVTFNSGDRAAIELSRCAFVSKYLYNSDLFGEDNRCLNPTLQLLNMQNQGIAEGIKNSASFRFMANVNNFAKAEDLKRERERFVQENMGPDSGGLALFPNTYTNVKQVISSVRVVDPEQMRIIQDRTFTYFGTNADILQNKAYGDTWSAYYEGKIEPFAIQLSQAMTQMCYSQEEQTRGNEILWNSSRLQYMTNADKLQVSSQMFDRGIFSQNMVNDIWGLPHVKGGDKFFIRKEYIEVSKLDKPPEPEATSAPDDKKEEPNNANTD